jgi:hypothetical protein
MLGASRISGAICVFLAWDEARRRLAANLRARGIPLRVWIVREEEGAPLDLGPMASDPRNFREVAPGTLEQELLKP